LEIEMSSVLEQRAANAAVKAPEKVEPAKRDNPANAPQMRVTEENRIPMSTPELKLSTPDIPGYRQYWFLSRNVERALRAGYTYVDFDEVSMQGTGYANDLADSGSTDLGTRVSLEAGRGGDWHNQPERLYLMKIRQEWFDQDQQKLEDRNEEIARALRGGEDVGDPNPHDTSHRHVPSWAPQKQKAVNNLFTRKPKR
jgi:hypothetical protein